MILMTIQKQQFLHRENQMDLNCQIPIPLWKQISEITFSQISYFEYLLLMESEAVIGKVNSRNSPDYIKM